MIISDGHFDAFYNSGDTGDTFANICGCFRSGMEDTNFYTDVSTIFVTFHNSGDTVVNVELNSGTEFFLPRLSSHPQSAPIVCLTQILSIQP